MPMYEYECDQCGKQKEEMRPITSRNDGPICKTCEVQMIKIEVAVNFKLLGSGWGRDGYAKKSDMADLV